MWPTKKGNVTKGQGDIERITSRSDPIGIIFKTTIVKCDLLDLWKGPPQKKCPQKDKGQG